jgi:UDP-N-acetylglucosamine 2-epimerase
MSKTTTTFQVETKLHHDFKLECMKQNKTMSEILSELMEKFVKNGKIK